MVPDEDNPQHELRRDEPAGVQEDHLPEHREGDEGAGGRTDQAGDPTQ